MSGFLMRNRASILVGLRKKDELRVSDTVAQADVLIRNGTKRGK